MPSKLADWLIPGLMATGAGLLVLHLRRSRLHLVVTNPVPGHQVVSGWGRPREYRNGIHYGIDIPASVGTPVYSPVEGRILVADNVPDSHAGRYVVVQAPTKLGPVNVRLMHLDRIDIFRGQYVKLGQQVGTVGKTGVVNAGAHLHLDVLVADGVLEEYRKVFGTPSPTFPPKRQLGTQVPAEALIPVSGYNKRTIADAQGSNVKLARA